MADAGIELALSGLAQVSSTLTLVAPSLAGLRGALEQGGHAYKILNGYNPSCEASQRQVKAKQWLFFLAV